MFSRIDEQYRGATAVVIGAGGIGAAICKLLDGHVEKLFVGDRDPSQLKSLGAVLNSTSLHTASIDVRSPESVKEFFQAVREQVGTPHYLFYTAGVLNLESLAHTTPAIWDTAVEINLNGAFYCAHAAAELMAPQKRGSILMLGSIAGTRSRSGSRVNPVYNATKAGLAAFVNSAAMQLRPAGVRINSISPGPTATAMMDLQPAQVHDAISEITLDRRQNKAEEVAELALFIAAHGRFTGEDIAMGGGAGLGG